MLFKNNSLILAPMAGITDTVFRSICREHGAEIVVSEMVSVEGILFGAAPTMELMHFAAAERPIGIQLFGSDPDHFARAAALVVDRFAPDFIDINAGCPVQKVVRKNGGASLLRDFKKFEAIVGATVSASKIPVTVKIRSGWNKYEWIDREFAMCAESCGAAAITLHPRSQTMMFSGHSFWERIALVKEAVAIPVIGNGDVATAEDGVRMKRETACDCIMIGRGAYGNPWLFSQVKAALDGTTVERPGRTERRTVALGHIARFRECFGEHCAVREMKKHAAWYCKGAACASHLRDRIFRAETTDEIATAVRDALG